MGCAPPDREVDRAGAPITNGTLDEGDDGVVGLVANESITCSGTLVAPRVVLTAAHCLVSVTVTSVVIGSDLASGLTIPAVGARAHPAFAAATLANDVGLVLLAEPAPAAPWPLLDTPFDQSFVGRDVRLVGFGKTSSADATAARKRQGIGTIDSFTTAAFDITARPSLTCAGDSGGPAFLTVDGTEYLAGITSAGDVDCVVFSRVTRVDAHLAWVAAFVAETGVGPAGQGDRCYYPEQCAGGACFFPSDAPTIGYCSDACDRDGDCPDDMGCAEDPVGSRHCRYPEPSPGALGSPCATYDDCDSLLCAHAAAGEQGSCSVTCLPDVAGCPAGLQCLQDTEQPALHACFPVPPSAAGCSVTRRPPGPTPWMLALLLVLLRVRRRRAWP